MARGAHHRPRLVLPSLVLLAGSLAACTLNADRKGGEPSAAASIVPSAIVTPASASAAVAPVTSSLPRASLAAGSVTSAPFFPAFPAPDWKYPSLLSIALDDAEPRNGHPTTRLSPEGKPTAQGLLLHRDAAPDDYRGKRIRISGYAKTSGITESAVLFARAKVPPSNENTWCALVGHRTALPKSADWARYGVVLDVPSDAESVEYGFELHGEGAEWVDEVTVDFVDPKTAKADSADCLATQSYR